MSNNRGKFPKHPSPLQKAIYQLKGILLSPYGIAAISSLSFHAVLFAAVPRFTSASFAAFDEEGSSEPRTVPLVTLSAAEQGRLPNFNRPQLSDLPDITASTPLNRLPNSTLLDRNSTNRSSSLLNRSSNRFNRNRSNYNRRITTDFRTTNPPTRSNQANPEESAPISIPPPPPAENFRETVIDEETLRKQREIEEQAAAELEVNNNNPEEGPGLPPLPDESGELTEGDEDLEIAAAAEPPLDRLAQLKAGASSRYDESRTSPDSLAENYALWESETEIEGDVAVVSAEETDSVSVGDGLNLLCHQQEPQNGEIGVLVGPDGTPLDASVLLSTGYSALNQSALEYGFEQRTYPDTDQVTRYRIAVTVDYDHEATCTNSQELLESAARSDEASPSVEE